jgi:hypothetical protein
MRCRLTAAADAKRVMNIVISALHFAWQDMRGCLAVAEREMGLDGVELSWHESFRRPHCTAQDMDLLASLRNEYSMRLSAHMMMRNTPFGNTMPRAPLVSASLGWVFLATVLCSGCATRSLHDAARERICYWGGAGKPQAYLSHDGILKVFEQGRYGSGDSRSDPPYAWHRIDLPLNRILSSLTNGQASVAVRTKPRADSVPDAPPHVAPENFPVVVRFVRIEPDAELPANAFPVPFESERIGTNFVPRYVWVRSRNPDSALVAYLERHRADATAERELLYLEKYQRNLWIWYERDGLKNGSHFVLVACEYPPTRTRWYLYAFAPLTVMVDVVTFPVQAVFVWYAARHIRFF